MKKLLLFFMLLFLCGCTNSNLLEDNGKINVMTVNFPQYDFAREIAGENANVKMLMPVGAESHTFEPSPQDILNIQNSDVFIYTGGESDSWVSDILASVDTKNMVIVKLMDICNPQKEDKNSQAFEHHEHLEEYDEHLWTSPKNAKIIVEEYANVFSLVDAKNSESYKLNLEKYSKKLDDLDNKFLKIVNSSKRKTVVFGDRFPFLYFVKDYGLEYYRAFPGCSEQTEPNIKTVKFLIDKVKEEEIPVVFYIEFSNHKIADEIAMETGAKSMLFHSCHNITKDEFKAGISYIDIMEKNCNVLEEALN